MLERFMFKGRGGKYKASARRLFHSILGFLAPNGFNVVLTAFLKHAGVKDYRKHIPSRKLLAKMMSEMRDISALHVASEISKAKEWTIYHD